MEQENLKSVPEGVIVRKIYLLRGQKIIFDFDLAALYNV